MQTVSRLIEKFIPEHYQLTLSIKQEERTFSGVMTMNGTLLEDTSAIFVHAKDLTINSVILDGKEASFKVGTNDEIAIAHPDLASGRHIVVISFNGTITDAMNGLYPCYYEHNGAKKELLATQFESHHAREVFPCIDEPEAKATFDITLMTDQNITVLGNMPIKKQSVENNELVTIFQTTPKMSTYLVAWVAGELHKKTAVTKSGVEVNVWATPAQKPESLDFALDIATRTIDFFNDYFDTPYPLPKSDHVALPDFSSGAMENWGLITYREIALLADPTSSSISSKHYIALVVAHELSHQWFGNLVTMKWWNDLWLNESFATLMEYIAIDALHPEWDIWLDFATQESIIALRRDSLDGVQPVQVDVHHPDEISTLFDGAIVYAKGARLLRMLQNYIGHEAFQAGLKEYFAKHAYRNTEAIDLWQVLSKASGKDIAAFMQTWISQPGFPVVKASHHDNKLTLTQEQFFVGPHEKAERFWPIPLNASHASLPALLDAPFLALPYEQDDTPLRLNVGDTAHFLTQYDAALLNTLISKLSDHAALNPLARLQLLHEQTLLARGGSISTATLIPLLQAYQHEDTEPVWDIINLAVGELKKFVESSPENESQLHSFAARLAQRQYDRLGWTQATGEPESDTKLRANVIALMLYGENPDAIRIALEMYHATELKKLDPELRSLIIGAAVRHGNDQSIIDDLFAAYKNTSSSDLQQDIASGLTSTKNPATIDTILSLLNKNTVIRHQDVFRWFAWTIRNRHSRAMAWQWVQNNWPWIKQTFGNGMSYDDFPRYAANALSTKKQLQEYLDFFTPLQAEPALTRVITLGIKEIEGRIELLERDGSAVRAALNKL